MESTCKKEKCYWWKKMKSDCPLYIVSNWRDEKTGIEVRIEDCSPVRNTLQLQAIHNLLVGLQKTSNEERNKSQNLIGYLASKAMFENSELLISGK